MTIEASRGDRLPLEGAADAPRAHTVNPLGVMTGAVPDTTAAGGASAVSPPTLSSTLPPALPSPLLPTSTPDARALIDRYRDLAIATDAGAAMVAGLVAVAIRFGLRWPLGYVLVTAALPLAWITLVALQRGYEARFLGNGPEEYRRTTIAAMVLF